MIFLINKMGNSEKPQYFINKIFKLILLVNNKKSFLPYLLKCPTAWSYLLNSFCILGTLIIKKPSFFK